MEEFLRCLSSVQGMARTVTRDVDLDGHTFRHGDRVLLVFGAGNRDEAKFPDGDRIVIDRQPNPHVAFGAGIHRCMGSNLARRELRVALEEFLIRYPDFSLAPGSDPVWHGIDPLPLVLERERRRVTPVLVEVDGERCQGHNRCVVACPQVFESDELGYAVVKSREVGPELEPQVRLAEADCPENAITVEEASTAG